MDLPDWFPGDPYPAHMSTMSDERYIKLVPDSEARTSITWWLSGIAYRQALGDVAKVLDISYQPPVIQLLTQLHSVGIKAQTDAYGTIVISDPPIEIWISRRPGHCDRGRWLVMAQSDNPAIQTIDAADAFPRYYFHDTSLVSEIKTWLDIRNARR